MISLNDRLIIPLDTPSIEEAKGIVSAVGEAGTFYKIGYQLMPIGGIALAKELSNAGKKVFLDFKFHDIGATVEKGTASVRQLGGDFLTVHAEPDVIAAAAEGRGDDPRLKILAVTVLTSLDQAALTQSGINIPLEDVVLRRAEFALKGGADGIVASAKEAAAVRARFGDALIIVTPGVRPQGASKDDQARVVTPYNAIKAGSDHLVVGRPITKAPAPKEAAQTILNEIESAIG